MKKEGVRYVASPAKLSVRNSAFLGLHLSLLKCLLASVYTTDLWAVEDTDEPSGIQILP